MKYVQIKVDENWLYLDDVEKWLNSCLVKRVLISLPKFYFIKRGYFIRLNNKECASFFKDYLLAMKRYKPASFFFSKEDLKRAIKDTLKSLELETTFSKELEKSLTNKEKEAWRQKLLKENKETSEFEYLTEYLKKL